VTPDDAMSSGRREPNESAEPPPRDPSANEPTHDYIPAPKNGNEHEPSDAELDELDRRLDSYVEAGERRKPIREWAGRVLNKRYQLNHFCVEGGQGFVFQGFDLTESTRIAIKIAKPDRITKSINDLKREADRTKRMGSDGIPGIVAYKSIEPDPEYGTVWMITEWLEGQTLDEMLRAAPGALRESIGWKWAFAITSKVLATLIPVHEKWNSAHLDIKPANIFLTIYDEVKLLDFGLAVNYDPNDGDSNLALGLGSPAYMAPEQFYRENGAYPEFDHARLGPLSDIYSLGATLYHMLVGTPPFMRDDGYFSYRDAHCSADRPDPRKCVPELELPEFCNDVVQRAMAKQPRDRYQSAAEFRQDLERYMETSTNDSSPQQESVEPPDKRSPAQRGSFTRARRVWLSISLSLTAVLLIALICALWPKTTTAPPRPVGKGDATTEPATFRGHVDVLVERMGADGKLRPVRLNTAGALPLQKSDKFRIEGRVDPPAYLYVIWVDPEHDVTPVYPWDATKGWGSRPATEERVGSVKLPRNAATPWYEAPAGKPGVATIVLIARQTPLDVPDEDLRRWFEELPELPLTAGGEQAAVWFDDYVEVQDPDRARTFKLVEKDDPFARWQGQLQKVLGGWAAFQTAVSFARTGGK
jgi:serine/threonine protein kinase